MLSALGNKVKRFCVIENGFLTQLITEGHFMIAKHCGSCIQTIATGK